MERNDLLEEFEDLMSLALFGEISEEQRIRLNQIVAEYPSLKERYENYNRMQEGLRFHKKSLAQSESKQQNISPIGAFTERLFKNRILLLAAIIPLIASLYFILRFQFPKRPDSISIQTLGACDAKTIQTREPIRLGENSFCDVKILLTQGSVQFKIFPNSEVRILHLPQSNDSKESLSIFFEKGKFLLNETLHSTGKTRLYWNGTQIELLGTKVLIEDLENGRSIKVWNGSVVLRSGVRYILPFLSESKETWVKSFEENNKELLNDIKEVTLSDSSLETKPFILSADSILFLTSENNPKTADLKKIQSDLGQIRNHLSLDLKENRTNRLTPEDLEDLETLSQNLGNEKLPELKKKKQEPIRNENGKKNSVVDEKKELKKEEPVRLGMKTIKLKDGSELKGNLIQYENEYVLEIDGKKKVIKTEDVESISF